MVGVSAISVMMVLEYVTYIFHLSLILIHHLAAHSDIYSPSFPSYGARIQHQEFSLPFSRCPINGSLWPIL